MISCGVVGFGCGAKRPGLAWIASVALGGDGGRSWVGLPPVFRSVRGQAEPQKPKTEAPSHATRRGRARQRGRVPCRAVSRPRLPDSATPATGCGVASAPRLWPFLAFFYSATPSPRLFFLECLAAAAWLAQRRLSTRPRCRFLLRGLQAYSFSDFFSEPSAFAFPLCCPCLACRSAGSRNKLA